MINEFKKLQYEDWGILSEHGGRIVKGVNTTDDVGPNEIKKQAKKFGNDVSRDGIPAARMSDKLFKEMKEYGVDVDRYNTPR